LRKAIAVLRDEINTALKVAMKARDEPAGYRRCAWSMPPSRPPTSRRRLEEERASDDDLLGLLQK